VYYRYIRTELDFNILYSEPSKSIPNFPNMKKNSPKTKITSNQKRAEATRAVSSLSRARNDAETALHEIAMMLVDPKESAHVIPQRTPGRLGSAVFPVITTIESTGSNPMPNFGVVVRPSLTQPVAISRPNSVPQSKTTVNGSGAVLGNSQRVEGESPCSVYFKSQSDSANFSLLSAPLNSDLGATLNFAVSGADSKSVYFISLYRRVLGGAWTKLAQLTVGGGVATQAQAVGLNWDSIYIQYAIDAQPVNAQSNAALSYQFALIPTAGAMSCGAAYDELVMDVTYPDWGNVLNASKFARVVACDSLLSYHGSTLDDAGSIAVANIDDEIVLNEGESLYDYAAKQPFDSYDGRLASKGEEPGGGHWHYVPTSDEQLIVDYHTTEDENLPRGLFGVRGLKEGNIVRVKSYFVLNFYSQSPEYRMEIPKPITGFSPLLWLLRTEIPLVTCNDRHSFIKDARRILKRGAKIGHSVATDPIFLAALSALL
jgi:hypothetical protein